MAVNAGSGRRLPNPPADSGRAAFLRRIASAAVLIPLALATVWYGDPWLAILVAIAAGLMSWEWVALTERQKKPVKAIAAGAIGGGCVLLAGVFSPFMGFLTSAIAIIFLQISTGQGGVSAVWTVGGILWIIFPSIGFLWLRDGSATGIQTALWLLVLVWSVDIAAYIAGRTIGGPKLVPRISPKKTWSGLIGGVVAAVLVGAATAWLTGHARWWQMALLSGVLGIVEQIGDIAESYAKRKFGAKDSSALIPGHGGLLDRLDGMLAVVTVVTLVSLAAGDVLKWK